MHHKLVAAALVVSMLPAAAMAQAEMEQSGSAFGPDGGDWEITFGGGGNTSQDIDVTDVNVNGSVGYFFTEAWEVSVRQSVIFSDVGESDLLGATRVALDYHFDLDRFRPFVGVNAGGAYGDSVNDTGLAGLEAGLKFYAREKTFLFGRGEYQWSFDSAGDADDRFDDGSFVYTFGIGFNF
jgi:hypothetical protein